MTDGGPPACLDKRAELGWPSSWGKRVWPAVCKSVKVVLRYGSIFAGGGPMSGHPFGGGPQQQQASSSGVTPNAGTPSGETSSGSGSNAATAAAAAAAAAAVAAQAAVQQGSSYGSQQVESQQPSPAAAAMIQQQPGSSSSMGQLPPTATITMANSAASAQHRSNSTSQLQPQNGTVQMLCLVINRITEMRYI